MLDALLAAAVTTPLPRVLLRKLAAALPRCRLTELHASECQVGDEGAAALAEALLDGAPLTLLDLRARR